jgi:triacylglycerol lipase
MAATRSSVRGALRLVGQGVDYMTARVHDVHRAIASQPYEVLERIPATRAGAAIVRPLHLGGTAAVYAAIRGTSRLVFAGVDAAFTAAEAAAGAAADAAAAGEAAGAAAAGEAADAAAAAKGAAPSTGAATAGDGGGVLSALLGEHLARDGNPLGVRMSLRAGGAVLPLEAGALAAALPGATGRVIAFVHGLGHDDASWGHYSERLWGQPGESYGARLAERHGYTPVYVRYNTGLRVADNGRDLAALLEAFAASYPVPLERLVLAGHSMGGLVVRSACHHALVGGRAWPALVSDVFCLGSPHLGAPLERFGVLAQAALGVHPVTAPFGRLLDGRSAGVKCLGDGAIADGDDVAFPAHARFHLLAGALADPDGLLTRLFGDGIVPVPSAGGAGRLEGARATFASTHHGELLNHPEVFAYLERHLA